MELAENKEVVQVKEMGFFSKIINIIFEPSMVFHSLKNKANVLGIMLLIIFSFTVLAVPKAPILEDYTKNMMEKMYKSETFLKTQPSMTKEQAEATVDMAAKFQKISSYFTGVLIVIMLLIEAVIILGVLKIFKGTGNFKQTFAVILFSSVISIIGELVRTINVVITGKADIANSLGLFMQDDKTSFLYNFINSIDIFNIWTLIITSIGLAVVHKVRQSRAYIAVFGVWLVYIMIASYGTTQNAVKMLNDFGITI